MKTEDIDAAPDSTGYNSSTPSHSNLLLTDRIDEGLRTPHTH